MVRGEDTGVLFELPEVFLDSQIRELADTFAAKLTPHVQRMCADWASGQLHEEVRLERIRKELVSEIERVKHARRAQEQRKRLELGSRRAPIAPGNRRARRGDVRGFRYARRTVKRQRICDRRHKRRHAERLRLIPAQSHDVERGDRWRSRTS